MLLMRRLVKPSLLCRRQLFVLLPSAFPFPFLLFPGRHSPLPLIELGMRHPPCSLYPLCQLIDYRVAIGCYRRTNSSDDFTFYGSSAAAAAAAARCSAAAQSACESNQYEARFPLITVHSTNA